jgi:hypothetical protein
VADVLVDLGDEILGALLGFGLVDGLLLRLLDGGFATAAAACGEAEDQRCLAATRLV